jgi:hypothetical protein
MGGKHIYPGSYNSKLIISHRGREYYGGYKK